MLMELRYMQNMNLIIQGLIYDPVDGLRWSTSSVSIHANVFTITREF